jgi:hypothetical protein
VGVGAEVSRGDVGMGGCGLGDPAATVCCGVGGNGGALLYVGVWGVPVRLCSVLFRLDLGGGGGGGGSVEAND